MFLLIIGPICGCDLFQPVQIVDLGFFLSTLNILLLLLDCGCWKIFGGKKDEKRKEEKHASL